MTPREQRFGPTTIFIVGSLLLWLLNFVVVYVFAALACARGFAGMRLIGLPIVPVVTTALSLATAVGTFVLLRRASHVLRDQAANESSRFIGFVAFTSSVVAIIALILLALPPILLSGCMSH